MGRIAQHILSDIASLESGEAFVTESPIGDRGESRAPAGQPNGRILLRLTRTEHAALVREAAEQGVSLNHYLTEIVCRRQRAAIASPVAARQTKVRVATRSSSRPSDSRSGL